MKLTYDDIQLFGKVKHPTSKTNIGTITSMSNFALLGGIDEPIFCVRFGNSKERVYFGLKYMLKNYIK